MACEARRCRVTPRGVAWTACGRRRPSDVPFRRAGSTRSYDVPFRRAGGASSMTRPCACIRDVWRGCVARRSIGVSSRIAGILCGALRSKCHSTAERHGNRTRPARRESCRFGFEDQDSHQTARPSIGQLPEIPVRGQANRYGLHSGCNRRGRLQQTGEGATERGGCNGARRVQRSAEGATERGGCNGARRVQRSAEGATERAGCNRRAQHVCAGDHAIAQAMWRARSAGVAWALRPELDGMRYAGRPPTPPAIHPGAARGSRARR
jgi:hypothetical protein